MTPSQATSNANVLALIAKQYYLTQRITAAEAATATLEAPFHYFAVWDSAANIAANLPAIQALFRNSTLAIVRMSDSGPPNFALSAAQVAANPDALRFISSPFTISLTDPATPTITLPVWEIYTAAYHSVIASITTPFTLALDGPMRTIDVARILTGADPFGYAYTMEAANPIAPLGTASAALLPSNLQVIDYQGRLSQYLPALQVAAEAGKLTSVINRDGGFGTLSLTPQQLTDYALALSKFSPNIQLSQTITAAQVGSATLDPRFFSFTVEDSFANIMVHIGAIDGLMRAAQLGKVRFTEYSPDITLTAEQLSQAALVLAQAFEADRSITLTDAGTPTLTMAGSDMAFSGVRSSVLTHITGNFNLAVSGFVSSFTAANIVRENTAVLTRLNGLTVVDFASNVATNIVQLQALATAGKLSGIHLIGGGIQSLNLSAEAAAANAAAIALVSSPIVATATSTNAMVLSTSEVMASLASLKAQAEARTLGNITLSDDAPTFHLPVAQLVDNLSVFDKITGNYAVNLTDATPQSVSIPAWRLTSTIISKVATSILNPDNFTFSVGGGVNAFIAARIASGPTVMARLTGVVNVIDYASNIPVNISFLKQLNDAGKLGTIKLLDGGYPRLAISAAQAADNAGVLTAIVGPYFQTQVVTAAAAGSTPVPTGGFEALTVTDSAANVIANLADCRRWRSRAA